MTSPISDAKRSMPASPLRIITINSGGTSAAYLLLDAEISDSALEFALERFLDDQKAFSSRCSC